MRIMTLLPVVLLAACALDAQSPKSEPLLGQSEWRMIEMDGQPSLGQSVVTLSLDMDQLKLSGSGGCNRLFGNFRLDGEVVKVGPVGLTKRFCVRPNGVMEQESRYVRILQAVDRFHLSGDTLTADGENGKLIFKRLVLESK
jgi:heat shock protein HslJ